LGALPDNVGAIVVVGLSLGLAGFVVRRKVERGSADGFIAKGAAENVTTGRDESDGGVDGSDLRGRRGGDRTGGASTVEKETGCGNNEGEGVAKFHDESGVMSPRYHGLAGAASMELRSQVCFMG
jgi:hypothetical protein